MSQAIVTLPDGRKAKVTFDTQEQLDAAVNDLVSSPNAVSAQSQQPAPAVAEAPHDPSTWGNMKSTVGKVLGGARDALGLQLGGAIGTAETAANIGSNMAAFPAQAVGSLYGMATAPEGRRMEQARNNINAVSGAMVYQPRTEGGKLLSKGTGFVLGLPAMAGDALGMKVADATGSTGLGAATSLGLQSIPVILGSVYASKKAAAAKAARNADAQPAAGGASNPEQAAQNYVATRTNLDWNNLSDSLKANLTKIAEDAKSLEGLDPAAVERQGRLESLGIKGTRGQITRNASQLRNEGNVSATEAGTELRKLYADQNKKIIGALEDVKKGTGGVADTAEQVGRSVQDTALRAKESASKARYDALYKKARATEPSALVHADPLYDFLNSNPEVQHTGWLGSWLKRAKIESTTSVDGIDVTQRRPVTLAELHDLRVKANSISKTGGTDGFYAGQVVKAIDSAMEDVPFAAKAWREANAAFRAHKTEFADQGAVAQLVENASRTDRSVALENTWRKTVIGGSIEDLAKVRKSLTTGSHPKIVAAGKQAWRDMGAQTVQHIIDEATKSVSRLEDGTPNVTPAAMERAIKSVGYDKLNMLFGPDSVSKIKAIMEATRDLKTEPPTGFKGSPTFANIITFLEKRTGWLPGGNMVTGSVRAAAKLREMGESGRQVRNALADPLADVSSKAGSQVNSFLMRNALNKYGTAAGVAAAENRR